MADWLSSLLAGLGSGAESLGASMSEREKRDAAAKQRAFELAMQQADKNAELGITDIAPQLPTTAAVNGIGNLQMPTPDPLTSFAKQISLGQGTGKNMVASPRFDVFNGTEAATGDMSDAATNADMSGAGMRGPVSAYGAPKMPRTKLGMDAGVPDVQAQLSASPMTTGGVNEGESTVMQYDPLHPEAGLLRKRFNYQAGSDYARKKAEENLPANMLARQNVESEIANRNATEKRTTAATKDLETKTKYVSSPTGFAADLAVLRRDPKNADVLSRVLSMTSGTPNQEVYHRLIESILIPKTDLQDKRQRITDETELRREYDQFQKAKTALLRNKATMMMSPDDLQAAQDNLADQERIVNMLADRQDAYGGSPTVYRTNRTLKAAPASASPGAGTKSYTTKSGKTFKVP